MFDLRTGLLPPPPVQSNILAVTAGIDKDDIVRVFWATSDGHPSSARLFSAKFNNVGWEDPVRMYEGTVRPNLVANPVLDSKGRLHLVVTAIPPSKAVPKALHLVESVSGWAYSFIPLEAGIYPRLAALADGLLFVGIGSAASQSKRLDVNSVLTARARDVSEPWLETTPVSISGKRPAFEPTLLVNDELIHVAWTKDLDGNSVKREALFHAFSTDSARTWSKPVLIARGRHIKKPNLLKLSETAALAVFAVAASSIGEETVKYAVWGGRRWDNARVLVDRPNVNDFAVAMADTVLHVTVSTSSHDEAEGAGTYYGTGRCIATASEMRVRVRLHETDSGPPA